MLPNIIQIPLEMAKPWAFLNSVAQQELEQQDE